MEPTMSELSKQNPDKPEKEKLPPLVMAACMWPLALMAVGGMLGGAFGGAAAAINMSLVGSKLPRWSLWLLNPLVGLTAVVLWLVIGTMIGLAISPSETG
tara:strand:- start:201735 stop:202034 length:300 start_codon:yes stop_codon:yes gene_type:complete